MIVYNEQIYYGYFRIINKDRGLSLSETLFHYLEELQWQTVLHAFLEQSGIR